MMKLTLIACIFGLTALTHADVGLGSFQGFDQNGEDCVLTLSKAKAVASACTGEFPAKEKMVEASLKFGRKTHTKILSERGCGILDFGGEGQIPSEDSELPVGGQMYARLDAPPFLPVGTYLKVIFNDRAVPVKAIYVDSGFRYVRKYCTIR